MTTRELIEILQQMPPDADVVFRNRGGLYGWEVTLGAVSEVHWKGTDEEVVLS